MSIISRKNPNALLYEVGNDTVLSISPKTGRSYSTNFIPTDIHENNKYLYGRWQGRFGYIRLTGVKHLIYKPNMFVNHVFKDDSLYVSYRNEPMVRQENQWGSWYSNYDFCLSSLDMVEFLYHCDYNEEKKKILMDEMEHKVDYYNEKFKDDLTFSYVDKNQVLPWLQEKEK